MNNTFRHHIRENYQSRGFSIQAAALAALLVFIFYPGLAEYVRLAGDAYWFNFDARQHLIPFLDSPASGSYSSEYFRDALPVGYISLVQGSSWFVDPLVFAKVLPFFLIGCVLFVSGLSAWRLAGPAAAFGAVALCLSSFFFFQKTTGGIPRNFAFPLASVLLFSLLAGRPYLMAVVTALGAAFYYPMAVVGGVLLAVYLFLLPPDWQGQSSKWSYRKRFGVLVITGLLTVALILPSVIAMQKYAPMIGPVDAHAFPEARAGVTGRYNRGNSPLAPPGNFFIKTAEFASYPLFATTSQEVRFFSDQLAKPVKIGVSVFVLAMTLYGILLYARREKAGLRVLLFPLVISVCYGLAVLLLPKFFLPERYLKYTAPLLVVVFWPAFLSLVVDHYRLTRIRLFVPHLTVAMVLLILLLTGGRGPYSAGFHQVDRKDEPVYVFIAQLDNKSVLAGWPTGIVDNVPYLTGKEVLLNFENHHAFHQPYALEMRKRMNALVAAYFATTIEPVLALKNVFGVTHLVVDESLFDSKNPPLYFDPFQKDIDRLFQEMNSDPVVLRLVNSAAVYNQGGLIILDLRMIVEKGGAADWLE